MSTAAPTAMQIERKDLNECTVQLDIVCSQDQVKSGFNKAIRQLGKKIRLPGFRPGQAPVTMVEKALPEHDIMNAGAEEIIGSAYADAVKEHNLTPAGQPMVELKKLDREALACEFSIKIPLPPVIELGEYKGVEVTKNDATVTDEEVDRQIEELRRKDGKQEKITSRGIQEGDMAVVNIRLDDQEGDGRSFMVIAGQTFESLDKLIAGMLVEEIKSADIEFPENFQEKDWAGQKHHAHVTIRSVSAVQVPDLDDEFAKNFNLENVDQLKERMRSAIEQAKEQSGRDMVNEQLMEKILANSKIVVADTTWESVAERRLQEIDVQLRQQKRTLEAYAKEQGMSVEDMVESLKKEAKLHVERAVVIEEIFRKEELEVTEADQNRHFIEILQENQVTQENIDRFTKEYGQQIFQEIMLRARYGKVMDFLNDNAVAVDAPSEKPAKKTPAKKAPAKKKETE